MSTIRFIFWPLLGLALAHLCLSTDFFIPEIIDAKFIRNYAEVQNILRNAIRPQIDWTETYKVGRALHSCPMLSVYPRTFSECNYAPDVIQDERAFKLGSPCNGCPEDECVDSICRVNWSPAWDSLSEVGLHAANWGASDGSTSTFLATKCCFTSLFVIVSFFFFKWVCV
ncbi:glioma pathogenesis-related protein 1 [Ambystoma mexicanum]|uniref:glioma pathogenesis-related protein 1 n=1 Tax=Ambystoma mexicanum TaxID=8296 RepID=UPI0037E8565E